jgi:uncharacterized RDD family membrane protein YckC
MAHELQNANLWKRFASRLFDNALVAVLAVLIGIPLSGLLGYDRYSDTMDRAYEAYETRYGVRFDISQEEYMALDEATQVYYDQAWEALMADEEAMQAYNMMLVLSLAAISLGVLAAVILWELVVPLLLGHGRTLGKKIFGLCLVRVDGVKVNMLQLFTRAILGKYAVETLIPILILMMMLRRTMGVVGLAVLFALLCGQVASLLFTRNHTVIHDMMAGTAVVDYTSQTIFETAEERTEYQKRIAAGADY